MQCPQCRQQNPPQAKFCLECGARFALTCSQCGTELPAAAKFCFECGRPVGIQSPAPLRFIAPEAYTPKHLAAQILTSRSALEGERKQVTVLFADLKSSMELLADRDPEEARKLLDPVLERMMEAVHRYEGTVNQVMGDGIMALFGAPIAHEDHAVRACYAALRIQESVRTYATEIQRTQGVPLHIRIGMNAGEVVVRSIGSDLHIDYTAVGQTTHLAARMEQMAMPGSILTTADVVRLAEGYVQFKPLGTMPIKGLGAPVEVYEVTGAGPVRTRLQVATVRGLTRFVGRGTELKTLQQALERARDGHGQVVAVVGEPGVGKSRLFYELTHSHRTHGWLILESSSVSYGKATSYLPVIDLLKAYFRIEAPDGARRIREKLTGKLLTLDRALEPMLPALLALLDMPIEDPTWQSLDPPQRRQRILDAVKRLLLGESQVQPLLVLFEDLHWIDSESQALLDSLVESLPTARIVLLVNYRPEYEHSWNRKTYYTQLRLDPLPPESAEELLQALLGTDVSLEPLKQLLIAQTEGNPFFLEESVRTLVETHAMAGERGAYRLAQALPSIQVPATVQAVLAARIDRLPPEEKRLLQTAAVIGTEVPFTLLQAIADTSEDALGRGLAHLQAAEFLYETSLFPDLEYTFKHALTHEVTYGNLLRERQRTLHARIVEAIERFYPDRLAEQVERLAHHALRGEVWDKALTYYWQAGVKAAARSAYREGINCFEQALSALQQLPASQETLEQAIDVRFDLRNALVLLGEDERVLHCLREAEGLAETLDDQRRLGQVCAHLSSYFATMGEYERAIESGQRTLTLANASGAHALHVQAMLYLSMAYHGLGDYRRALESLQEPLVAIERQGVQERLGMANVPAVVCLSLAAWCLAELGAFAEGSARAGEGIRLAEAVDHPNSRVIAYYGASLLYLRQGDFPKAIPLLEWGLSVCQAGNFLRWLAPLLSTLGVAYVLSGRMAEALPLLEQAVDPAVIRRGFQNLSPFTRVGAAYLLMGRLEEAEAMALRALEHSHAYNERGQQAWALRLFGEVYARRDPLEAERAEDYYRRSLALAEELGMQPLVAHCHLGLGTLYGKINWRDQARAELSTAIELYRTMEMRFWRNRAETASARVA